MKNTRFRLERAFFLSALALAPGWSVAAQTTHRLVAGPETVAFGHYDPEKPGVIRIQSGDFVEVTTMLTSNPTRLESMGLPPEEVQPNLRATSIISSTAFLLFVVRTV